PDFTSASRLPWLNATNAATLSVFFFSIPGFVAGFVVSIAADAGADPTLIVVTVSAAAVVALPTASAVTAITSTAASAAAVTLSAMVSTGSATGLGSASAGFIAALGFWLIIVSPVRSVRRHRRHPGLSDSISARMLRRSAPGYKRPSVCDQATI